VLPSGRSGWPLDLDRLLTLMTVVMGSMVALVLMIMFVGFLVRMTMGMLVDVLVRVAH
jgi:hypothetical protein